MRVTWVRRLLGVLAVALPLLLQAQPAQAAYPRVLDRMGSATQVGIVTTPSWRATRGGMTLWQKGSGTWRRYLLTWT